MTTRTEERESCAVHVHNHGTIHIVEPQTDEASEWLRSWTSGRWNGGRLVVEPRYTVDLLLGMQEEGFRVPLERREEAL